MKLKFLIQLVVSGSVIFAVIFWINQLASANTILYPPDNLSHNSLQIDPAVAEVARQVGKEFSNLLLTPDS